MKHLVERYICCRAFSNFFESLSGWKDCCAQLGILSTMTQQDYDVLLKGVDGDVYIPLWASASVPGRPLMDETTLAVLTEYDRCGWAPQIMDSNPPDYLGTMFRFLQHLWARASGEGTDGACKIRAEAFTDRFLVPTLNAFRKGLYSCDAPRETLALMDCIADYLCDRYPAFPSPLLAQAEGEMARHHGSGGFLTGEKRIIRSAGIGNCGGKCRIDITVQDGCALGITTDSSQNDPQLRACVRGRAYRQSFLSPHRLRYPMQRIGKRGEGKFKRISWQEAAELIAGETKRIGQTYGPGSRYFAYATGNCAVMRGDHLLKRLLNLDGGYLGHYNSYSSACSTFVSPYIYGDAAGGSSEQDMLSSRLLILWGHNPAETLFGSLRNRYLAEAKKKGIPIVVIDPRQSDTALSLADQWIPLRPTTDGALADAMAYVIVSSGLHDLDFLHRYCQGFDEETLPAGARPGSSYLSYLLGRSDGVPKTPCWAEAICGVPAQVIESLAIRYASTKPAAILPGLGPQRHGNGEQTTRAIAALCCLTGNVGKSGGSSGLPSSPPQRPEPSLPKGKRAFPGKIPVFLWTEALYRAKELTCEGDGLVGVDRLTSNIKLIFNIAGNTLINQHAQINRTKALLEDEEKCELIVVSDLFMTPSARYADILLPAASLLECDNISAPWFNEDQLFSNAAAVKPLFESMDDFRWTKLIAGQMGLEEPFCEGHESQTQWLQTIYRELAGQVPELPDYDSFRRAGGTVCRNAPLRVAYQENIRQNIPFSTPSGKIELYSPRLAALNHPELPPIPCYVPSVEGPEDGLRQKYPLQLIGYHTKYRCHSIHDRNGWLEELDPPALWIHPDDAAVRGIGDGELVEVFNDRGRVRIPAKVTGRIMRGVTAMSQGGWHTPDRQGTDTRGSINVLTRADRPTPLAKGNPQHTNLVQVQKCTE